MFGLKAVNLKLGLYVNEHRDRNVHRYSVNYFDSGHSKGNLCLVYTPFNEEKIDYIRDAAGLEGLMETDNIAWLDQFFPHGKEHDESLKKVETNYMRKGIGSYLLDFLLEEAKSNNAKFIWAKVDFDNPYMPGFLEKHGFRKLENAPVQIYYKNLN